MATIQIRDVPEDVHELLTGLAQQSGQSLQAYMRQLVINMASACVRKATALAKLGELLDRDGGAGITAEQIVADLEADRP